MQQPLSKSISAVSESEICLNICKMTIRNLLIKIIADNLLQKTSFLQFWIWINSRETIIKMDRLVCILLVLASKIYLKPKMSHNLQLTPTKITKIKFTKYRMCRTLQVKMWECPVLKVRLRTWKTQMWSTKSNFKSEAHPGLIPKELPLSNRNSLLKATRGSIHTKRSLKLTRIKNWVS